MPSKSIFRQPGAQHFQLVHRSQRDPRIHDPDASSHVLRPFERENAKKGKSRTELERDLALSEAPPLDPREDFGQAALYGITYDDSEYDYMQHLRAVGDSEEGVDSILLEAPIAKRKGKGKDAAPLELKDIPEDALPSKTELERNYESGQAIPSAIAGFQPDMDPHLRQTLEALEDDAFVEDDLEDDFFGELVKDGELSADEELDFEFHEDGIAPGEASAQRVDEEDAGWEARFALFKKQQKADDGPASEDDFEGEAGSEGADTVGQLPHLPVIGGKRRRKGASDASGYSLTSSSMFRNAGLTALDDQFDKIEREYDEDASDGYGDEDGSDDGSDEAPDLTGAREDFDALMDDFLDNFEQVGNKMRPVIPGETPAEKLNTLRRAMADATGARDQADADVDDDEKDIPMPHDIDQYKDRWDCETILSTYTNLENHPRLIRAREKERVVKIRLDPRTGLPIVDGEDDRPRKASAREDPRLHLREEVLGHDGEPKAIPRHSRTPSLHAEPRQTIARPPHESTEEKRARKQAVKKERQARRVEKKVMKESFSAERKHQLKVSVKATPTAGMKKL
ncbi:hypothetical protein BOTBODRAFT_145898 [Botryobasidium botryosum FD-172 SS1]|uniref:Low temperature viability protein n=1 Tax=Botryobasidium botryosum (strain FD-172 SS1) TaxID=930990 RepID=A0A067MH21_BOTB1|nr:hypothetical protein BOTBODRAFT_145898 [Botryobasidium botryosum FD-172 SS1]